MNHWQTHLYTFAVALMQGDRIKPENLEGMRRKAIKHGHSVLECVYVEHNAQLYIATGIIDLETLPLEIQAFGMIKVADGSRLAQDREAPDFFDVVVSAGPFEGGEIAVIEEHEGMCADQAAVALEAMEAAYPAAPISSVNCDLGAVA